MNICVRNNRTPIRAATTANLHPLANLVGMEQKGVANRLYIMRNNVLKWG
jgi:hypothetical protein